MEPRPAPNCADILFFLIIITLSLREVNTKILLFFAIKMVRPALRRPGTGIVRRIRSPGGKSSINYQDTRLPLPIIRRIVSESSSSRYGFDMTPLNPNDP
jgi:hypothetical protein